MGRVVHVKRDSYTVWVARGSVWGNPFKIGEAHPETGEPIVRAEAIDLYKEWIVRGEGRHLLSRLGELEGETLGCFCAPAKPGGVGEHDPLVCHGQILLKLVAWRRNKIEEKRQDPDRKDGAEVGRGFNTVPRRTVFCGSRGWEDPAPIREALVGLPEGTVVVAGGARGADRVAEREARALGMPVEVYPARLGRGR